MSYINYTHRADIYEKLTTTSAAGQKLATWTNINTDIKCVYIPKMEDMRNRVIGKIYTSDQIIQLFFPPDTVIDFNKRIYNIKDLYNNILEDGPIEITSIVKAPYLNGKIHHIEVAGYKVMED